MATHIHTCPLCEATCGLRIETDNGNVESIRGDDEDVFSRGFICPKAHGLKALHEDPDRLRQPLVRRDGELREASWAEAWQAVEDGLAPLLEQHGRNAVAVYLGNPSAHNLSANVYAPVFLKALGSQNIYSASTVDQMPKQVAAGLMFGAMLSVPVPDLDRCEHLLVLGANPLVSNGSLMTSPNARGRIRAIRERGGKVVVIDPRRSRTADEADEHHAIVPGTDAHFLFGDRAHALRRGPRRSGAARRSTATGIDEVERLAARLRARARRRATAGSRPDEIRRIARELAAAPARRVLRPDRHVHAGVRHARELARRRGQRADRQPRPRGRRDVHARGRRAAQLVRHAGRRQGREARPLEEPRARPARGLRRAARSCAWPRRSRRQARARCARSSRWRATRWSRRRSPSGSTARSRSSTSWSRSTST